MCKVKKRENDADLFSSSASLLLLSSLDSRSVDQEREGEKATAALEESQTRGERRRSRGGRLRGRERCLTDRHHPKDARLRSWREGKRLNV